MLSFCLYHPNPLVDHLSRKGLGFQHILYKFIVWTLLGLSPYLCYARNPNYDFTVLFSYFNFKGEITRFYHKLYLILNLPLNYKNA